MDKRLSYLRRLSGLVLSGSCTYYVGFMERAVVVKSAMAELIHAKFLSWRHLHLLEDPFFAKADVESAVNIHKSRGMARNRGISNFQSWLDRTSMPLGDLTYEVMTSLKNGSSYYVHRHMEKPRRPLLYWKSTESHSDRFFGINGGWEVHDYVAPALRNKLRILLTRIEPPKPVVLRKAPADTPQQTAPVDDTPRDERHMFQLEVESENDVPLPEKLYITLVAFNKTQDARPVHQVNDIVWDFESRIFRAKPGDSFEVFAITDQMKAVKKDLRDNKNLTQSVNDQLIAPLEITDTFNRADDVVVHTVKYVVPEVRSLIINYEYGKHDSKPKDDILVLVHEDSDWIQTIYVGSNNVKGDVAFHDDGWVKITFEDIPKEGKFSLYSENRNSNASPATMFSDKTESELMAKPEYTTETAADIDESEEDLTMLGETFEWEEWLTAVARS